RPSDEPDLATDRSGAKTESPEPSAIATSRLERTTSRWPSPTRGWPLPTTACSGRLSFRPDPLLAKMKRPAWAGRFPSAGISSLVAALIAGMPLEPEKAGWVPVVPVVPVVTTLITGLPLVSFEAGWNRKDVERGRQ